MAWTSDFVAALASLEVWLRFALVRGALWDEYTATDPFAVLSHPRDPMLMTAYPGAVSGAGLAVSDGAALMVTDNTLDMRACRGGGSGLTAQIVGGVAALRSVMLDMAPGTSVQLVAFASSDQGVTWWSEVVFHGRVSSMRRQGPRLDVDVLGIDAALSTRPNATLANAGRILADSNGTPVGALASAFNASDTHVQLAAAPPWTPTAPAKGVVVFEHGGEFAATYTGVATGPHRATGLPGVSTVSTSSSALAGADVVDAAGRPVATYKERIAADPPLSNAPSGTVVRFPAYFNGHPIAAIRRIVTSRGTIGPTNGADDVLPWQWGLGIARGYLDTADMAVDEAVTAGALLERLEEIRDRSEGVDGAAFLDELAAQAGFFLAQRMGRLTVRAVPLPYGSSAVAFTIVSADLAAFTGDDASGGEGIPVDHDPWPSAFPSYRQLLYVSNAAGYHVRTYAYTGPVSGTLVEGAAALVLTDRWGPHGASDTAVIEAGDRLWASQMAVPEVYTVSLRGLHWAQMCKGDLVSLTLDGEISRQGSGVVDGYRGVVLSCSADWLSGIVRVEIACFRPDYDPEDPDYVVLSDVYAGGQD